jgi:hypothetical protein
MHSTAVKMCCSAREVGSQWEHVQGKHIDGVSVAEESFVVTLYKKLTTTMV